MDTKQALVYAVWHLSGRYFDSILDRMPYNLSDAEYDDWLAFQLGL